MQKRSAICSNLGKLSLLRIRRIGVRATYSSYRQVFGSDGLQFRLAAERIPEARKKGVGEGEEGKLGFYLYCAPPACFLLSSSSSSSSSSTPVVRSCHCYLSTSYRYHLLHLIPNSSHHISFTIIIMKLNFLALSALVALAAAADSTTSDAPATTTSAEVQCAKSCM